MLEEKERMREERRRKAAREKLTFKIGYVQNKISHFLKKLPREEKEKFESEQEKSRRQKLKEIRETMWKKSRIVGDNLQIGEKLQAGENLQQGEQVYNLEILEEKLETVEKIYKRCEEDYAEKIRKSEEEKKTESEKRRKKEERPKVGNNTGQLCIANTTSGGARKVAWANVQ